MAVTRRTQKDVDKFKAKFAGPFTLKETLIIGAGLAICMPLYFTLSEQGYTMEDLIPIILIIMGVAVFLAKGNPYGMPAITFVQTYYRDSILSPKKRPYVVSDGIDYIEKKEQMEAMKAKGKDRPKKKVYKYKKDKDNPRFM